MSSVYLQCVGALSGLSAALAFKMSLFRLAGSPGENDPKSALNSWYLTQSLAAEWNPLVIGLLLALHLRGDNSAIAVYTALAVTISRFLFASRAFLPVKVGAKLGMPAMITSYVGVFLLSAKLAADF